MVSQFAPLVVAVVVSVGAIVHGAVNSNVSGFKEASMVVVVINMSTFRGLVDDIINVKLNGSNTKEEEASSTDIYLKILKVSL